MKVQFDPERFIDRERFKFWSEMKRNQVLERNGAKRNKELASRIRQDAATNDFPSINDPLDEALIHVLSVP